MLSEMRRGLLSVVVCSLFACKAPPIEAPSTEDFDGLPPGMTALLQPRGEPERLLGLPVEIVEGTPVIADARRPGCEVRPREVPTQSTSRYREELGRTAAFAAGWREVADLRVEFGKNLRVESEVTNTRELHADMSGTCGENVITRVLIGTGWREQWYDKGSGGAAKGEVQGARLGGEGGDWHRIGGRFEWTEPQAWAFALGDGGTERVAIRIDMPDKLKSGERFKPKITVEQSMWLIVLYRDAEGNHGVVFPAPGLSAYRVAAGADIELPSMIASTLPGHDSDFETLIVYGFPEEGDFVQLAPPAGALSPQKANEYAVKLEQQLADPNVIPRARWLSTTFDYQVVAP